MTAADAENGRGPAADGKAKRHSSVFQRNSPPPSAPKSLRCVMPQILSCTSAGFFSFSEGLSLSYSSSLIPQLQEKDSDIPITLEQGVLLASSMVVSMSIGTLLTGIIMNQFGRLNTIRYCTLPFALGWFLVATATTYEQILVGRVVTGLANPLGINSAVVFTTEVAASHIRGALNAAHPTMASAGIVAMYVLGAVTDWRTAAWVCGASPVVLLVLLFLFCHESPIWLVSRGRHDEALRSLRAYARCNDTEDGREKLPERQLEWLIQKRLFAESQAQNKMPWYHAILDLFRTPVGYKPLIMLTAVFVAQSFSGVYITLFYAAPFFQEMGVKVDAFQAAIYIGLTRFTVGLVAVGLVRGVGIRKLMVGSSFGMAVCMVLSGYFTLYPEKGLDGWVAVGLVLVYVAFSCCGLLTVPWTMTAELFPDQLRDVGQSFSVFIADMLMFAGLQLYPTLKNVLQHGEITGAVGLQWFFATVALLNVVFVIFFLPETHGKTLQEIEEHYQYNTMWLGRHKMPKMPGDALGPAVPTLTAKLGPENSICYTLTAPATAADSRKSSGDSSVQVSIVDTYRL
ncbi:hypothetical protein ONE63_007529 [Megalurothrips usitatus]|uniref:Major facilitator superfamily (MFS) profile domain-containing protein n=1 Tax=Megalurothrips usitatus TaxID=439358 RepID=A0AAV7XS77_9NEOP|nr:hypothetical protein ONE63_007529 [Megalurothrips usitatus]